MKNARTAAYAALLQVDVNAGYSNIVIDKAIKEADWTKGMLLWPQLFFMACWNAELHWTISSISFPEYL
ncbi:MAG: hypothetical protein V8Q17_11695 [Acutalibacteraceae bacterium]